MQRGRAVSPQALQQLEGLLPADAAAARDEAPRPPSHSLLPQVELVRALLAAGVPVSLPELPGDAERRGLCERLLREERFELAHALCTKCGVRAGASGKCAYGMTSPSAALGLQCWCFLPMLCTACFILF